MNPSTPGPSTQASPGADRAVLTACVAPFAVFMLGLVLSSLISKFGQDLGTGAGGFWLSNSEYWVYPLQTAICAWLLWKWWPQYDFNRWTGLLPGIAAGVAAFVLWITPQQFLGHPPRLDGFNPDIFKDAPGLHGFTLAMRLLRLVVVVPFLEELFWRGFLMRYLVRERFVSVPFGTFTPLAFFTVAICFALVHNPSDRVAALLTGLLWNALACRTRSLGACVVAHATANLLLGIYILRTGQWGFW